jgi:hypothetical protein
MSSQPPSPSRSPGGRIEQGNGRDHSLNASAASRPTAGSTVRIGLIAGAVAGMMMAMWQMVVGALADEPTAVEGVTSSFWTAVTSIPSVLFGIDWFHEDFEFGAVALGLGGHMMNAMMLGIVGVALLIAVQGHRPSPLAAVMQGVMLGLILEVVIVHLIVNPIQDVNTLYTSTPEWSWWVSHAIFGMTLGLLGSLLLRRRGAGGQAGPRLARP